MMQPPMAISNDAVDVIQTCTSEWLSLVVSEARTMAVHNRSSEVSTGDLLAAAERLGYGVLSEPAKKHVRLDRASARAVIKPKGHSSEVRNDASCAEGSSAVESPAESDPMFASLGARMPEQPTDINMLVQGE